MGYRIVDWDGRIAVSSLYEPAIDALQKGVELWPGPTPIAMLGEAYAAAWQRDEVRSVLKQLDQLSKNRFVSPFLVARIHFTLGETTEALHLLEVAYQQRADWMVVLRVDPCFDDLRPDPRFQDLLRRMNFPP